MAPLASFRNTPIPRANLRLAFYDDSQNDVEVKVYQLKHNRSRSRASSRASLDSSRSESKKPDRSIIFVRNEAKVEFADDQMYHQIWRRASGKVDRLESIEEEFGRASEWFESAVDDSEPCGAEDSQPQRSFRQSYNRRARNVPDVVPLMLDVFRESEEFFSQKDLKWPSLDKYRQEVWRDRESLVLQAFRSAFSQEGEASEHVYDLFYTFQCILPGVLVLSHEDSRLSDKGSYRVTRCLPPLAWVRQHEQRLLHIFPSKYRLGGQGLYHLGHHCATAESALVLEFRPRPLESQSTSTPLLPWNQGKTERSWRRHSFFS